MSVSKVLRHNGFSDALLSLRGIAAMMVVIFHSMYAFKVGGIDPKHLAFPRAHLGPGLFINDLIMTLTNGGAAVTFFFVHSGFVLALSLDKDFTTLTHGPLIVSFWLKRVFRLFPVIFMAAFLGLLVSTIAAPIINPHVSAWVGGFFPKGKYSFTDALIQAITIGSDLNKFSWTLRVEAIVSLIFPMLYLAFRKTGTALVLSLVTAAFWSTDFNTLTAGIVHGYFAVIVICFYLGIIVGVTAKQFRTAAFFNGFGEKYSDQVILALLVPLIWTRKLLIEHEKLAILIEALASVPIISLIYYVKSGCVFRFCERASVKFLGRLSYSMYMIAPAGIYLAIKAICFLPEHYLQHGLLMNILTAIIATTITVILATVSYYALENPLTVLGKKLARRIFPGNRKPIENLSNEEKTFRDMAA